MLKTILTDDLYQYALDYGVHEHRVLQELRKYTNTLPDNHMATTPDQAQFMGVLAKIANAKKYLEVGVYTGYNVLSMALAMGADAQIFAVEKNSAFIETAKTFWQKAGYDKQINCLVGDATIELYKLSQNPKHVASFDMVFIDANKSSYIDHYNLCFQLVKPHGIILIDNVFMHGKVLDKNQPKHVKVVHELNQLLNNDKRIIQSMLPIQDGLTIVYKLAN